MSGITGQMALLLVGDQNEKLNNIIPKKK